MVTSTGQQKSPPWLVNTRRINFYGLTAVDLGALQMAETGHPATSQSEPQKQAIGSQSVNRELRAVIHFDHQYHNGYSGADQHTRYD